MRILFDTNVILDVLLDRPPFSTAATALLVAVERGTVTGFLGATTLTTLHYLIVKARGADQAQPHLTRLLRLFEVAPINRAVLETALAMKCADFEDAVLHEAGRHAGVQGIVTRDPKGFSRASLAIYSPPELLQALATLS